MQRKKGTFKGKRKRNRHVTQGEELNPCGTKENKKVLSNPGRSLSGKRKGERKTFLQEGKGVASTSQEKILHCLQGKEKTFTVCEATSLAPGAQKEKAQDVDHISEGGRDTGDRLPCHHREKVQCVVRPQKEKSSAVDVVEKEETILRLL